MFNLALGLTGQGVEKVVETNTAVYLGSGSIPVYATPAMIALMEKAAVCAVDPNLPTNMATVGIHLDVKHLKATPLGMQVRSKAKLEKIEGKKLFFMVEAFDEKELIGQGTHIRYIVEKDKFLKNTESK